MKKSVKERIKKEVGNLVFSYCKPKGIDEKELNQTISAITEILKDMECMKKAEIKKEHKTSPIVEATLDAYNQHIDEFWKEWEGKDK